MGHLPCLLATWSCASAHSPLKKFFFISSLRRGMGQVHVCGRSVRWECQHSEAAQLSTAGKPRTTRAAEARVSHVLAWSVLEVAQNSLRGQPAVGMTGTPWSADTSQPATRVAAANILKGSMTAGTAYKSMKAAGLIERPPSLHGTALRNTSKTLLLMPLPDMLVRAVWQLGRKRSSHLVLTPFGSYL